jgi:hypothetical protein
MPTRPVPLAPDRPCHGRQCRRNAHRRSGGLRGDRSRPTETAFAIAERLAAADRSNTLWQRDLAVSYAKLASIYLRQDNTADALVSLRKGRDIMAALVAIAPNNAQWKKDLALFDSQKR